MATVKSLTELKNVLKTSRLGLIEVMRQVNSKNKIRYFTIMDDVRHQMTKELYDELDSMALRKDTIYSMSFRNCFNHFKTIQVNY